MRLIIALLVEALEKAGVAGIERRMSRAELLDECRHAIRFFHRRCLDRQIANCKSQIANRKSETIIGEVHVRRGARCHFHRARGCLGAFFSDRNGRIFAAGLSDPAAASGAIRTSRQALERLMENPRRLLSAILLGDALVNFPLIMLCAFFDARNTFAPPLPFWVGGAAHFRAHRFRLRSRAETGRARAALSRRENRRARAATRSCRVFDPLARLLQRLSETHRRSDHARAVAAATLSERRRTGHARGAQHRGRRLCTRRKAR